MEEWVRRSSLTRHWVGDFGKWQGIPVLKRKRISKEFTKRCYLKLTNFAEEKGSPTFCSSMVMTYLTFHGIISELLGLFQTQPNK